MIYRFNYISFKDICQQKYILLISVYFVYIDYNIKKEAIIIDYETWFSSRLSQLRNEKGVSAREMSLSLGQSESYINKIENQHTMPSMQGFFYICEYLDITPNDFFDIDLASPQKTNDLFRKLKKLTPAQAEHIIQLISDLTD